MRPVRILFRPHVPAWRERWCFAELIHKGANVDIDRDGAWVIRWP